VSSANESTYKKAAPGGTALLYALEWKRSPEWPPGSVKTQKPALGGLKWHYCIVEIFILRLLIVKPQRIR
jgi:hypothetical protein